MSAVSKGDARAVADLSTGLILASVEIAAPPERVFAALSTAEVKIGRASCRERV